MEKLIKRLSLLTVVFSIAVGGALFPTCVLAQPTAAGTQGQPATTETLAQPTLTATVLPTATVALNPASSCSSGVLQVSITTPIDRTREYGIVTTSTGDVLGEFEHGSGPGTSYTGSYYFPFNSSVPNGTIVTLYGYMGQTPPKAANTAEFSVSYRCDTDGVFAACAGPYGPCATAPDFPVLNGRWFKLNAVVTGNKVSKGNGVIKPHRLSKVPFYMGFTWNTTINQYYISVYTETAPGVWANTFTTARIPPITTQSILSDVQLRVNVNNGTDYFWSFHTPYIKYGLTGTGVLKTATYSGTGEVYAGSFDGGTTEYYGSVKISGSMVDVSKLPFTP
jgi:hypothetical protein